LISLCFRLLFLCVRARACAKEGLSKPAPQPTPCCSLPTGLQLQHLYQPYFSNPTYHAQNTSVQLRILQNPPGSYPPLFTTGSNLPAPLTLNEMLCMSGRDSQIALPPLPPGVPLSPHQPSDAAASSTSRGIVALTPHPLCPPGYVMDYKVRPRSPSVQCIY
jgi:hypothetical protein